MKAQFIICTLMLVLISFNGFARTTSFEDQPKKEIKPKYDFNIFKLMILEINQSRVDSTLILFQLRKNEEK